MATTSGLRSFRLDIGQAILQAYALNGFAPESVLSNDLEFGKVALNLVFSDWTSRGNTLFELDQQVQPITVGQSRFTLPVGTVDVVEATLRQTDPVTSQPLDAPFLTRISRADYLAKPDKTSQGIPTQYWIDRQYTPIFTFYQTPNVNTYSIVYNRVKQIEDIVTSAESPDVPYRWQHSLVRALAVEVALFKKNYEAIPVLKGEYDNSYARAAVGEGDSSNGRVIVDLGRRI